MGCGSSVAVRLPSASDVVTDEPHPPRWYRRSGVTSAPLFHHMSPADFAMRFNMQERIGVGSFAAVWCENGDGKRKEKRRDGQKCL